MVIGVNHILDSIECNIPSGKHDIEDLIRLQRAKRTVTDNENPTPALVHLLIDVETTLERLYGGFYSDWLAGGEWSHLYTYILSLLKPCQDLSLCLIFCFDGTLYRYGQSQWYGEQIHQRKKVNQIFKHLKQNKSGLPRRHLWLCPPAFQLCLRLILRELNSPHLLMYQTWGYGHDQHQEQLKSYAMQYHPSLLGIVSADLEFLMPTQFDNQALLLRYFSSKHFKLSLKGKLTLMEITLDQLKERFSLNDQQLSLLFTLLGNHLFSESDLVHFHTNLLRDQEHATPLSGKRISLKMNGAVSPPIIDSSSSLEITNDPCSPDANSISDTNDEHPVTSPVSSATQTRVNGTHFASGITVAQLIPRLVDYIHKHTLENEIDLKTIAHQVLKHLTDEETRTMKTNLFIEAYAYYFKAMTDAEDMLCPSQCSSSQGSVNKSDEKNILESCPNTSPEVIRTALNLHQQGRMMPWVLQCLYKREITFPVTIEPEMCNAIPNICEFYRPIRQYLYSILFAPQTIVREQVYNSEHGSYLIEVCCEPLLSTCTIEQLWFGSNPDGDRQLRLKTFLQSLQYCDRPRFYTLSHDYLLLVCILRYMYVTLSHHSSTSVGIHTYEWMAFISQAVLITELQPKPLMNLKTMHVCNQYEHIQIANYETRPVQLAHLFMRGLETMVFANEVCGSPIHPRYACPSHFFNGKLFHQKYLQAQYYQQTQDLMALLCDGNVHCAQIGSQLLDVVLDRTSNGQTHHTPMQVHPQSKYSVVPPAHQQRVAKQPAQPARPQTLLANSTRPPMRTLNRNNNAMSENQQHRTPLANHRQQPSHPPPPVKQAGPMKNGATKVNPAATPFNAKTSQRTNRFTARTPTAAPVDQWNHSALSPYPPQPLHMQAHCQQPLTMHGTPSMSLSHPPSINHNYNKPLDEQFLHLQIHPACMMASPTMVPYPPGTPMINAHHSMASFNHLHSSSPMPAYGMTTGPAFYQPSPPFQVTLSHPMTTPYQPHNLQIMPGMAPHAPVASQRAVHFTGAVPPASNFNGTPFSAPPQRHVDHLSPNEYTQYDLHQSTPHNGYMLPVSIPVQSHHYPSMIAEYSQRPGGHC